MDTAAQPAPAGAPRLTLHMLLKAMVERGASDLHVTAGTVPQLRIDGRLVPLRTDPLTPEDSRALCYEVLNEQQRAHLEQRRTLDLSFGVKNLARFRINLFYQRGAVAGAFRQIPYQIRRYDELGLPRAVVELARLPRGLILIAGPTGSGKSTTLASIIDIINGERQGHIITIEDPIEYVHAHKSCVVSQREVGVDTQSYQDALKAILRQDPDVVLIGELRDLEAINAAMAIADTGHLTLATLHTNSAAQTITRLIDAHPPHQQAQVRAQLAFVLQAVLCQQLLPKVGGGQVLATELLLCNQAVRNLIREDKVHQIYTQMQVGRSRSAMHTMNQSLLELIGARKVRIEDAVAKSPDPDELRRMLNSGGAA